MSIDLFPEVVPSGHNIEAFRQRFAHFYMDRLKLLVQRKLKSLPSLEFGQGFGGSDPNSIGLLPDSCVLLLHPRRHQSRDRQNDGERSQDVASP
jgi:hypothetical protein